MNKQPTWSTWVALALLALLALFVLLVLSAGSGKSETIDEGLFIAGGAVQVRQLNPNIDLSHPPLLRWVAGVPTVWFGGADVPDPAPIVPRGPMDLFGYKVQDVFDYGVRFFYDAGNSHDRTLFWGRFPFAFIGAALGWLLFSKCRQLFGLVPALAALVVFLFTPEVLAHAEWAHSDLPSALTIVLVSTVLAAALLRPAGRTDALLGASLGVAVGVKLTALLMLPLVLVLLVVHGRRDVRELVRRVLIVGATFYVTLLVVYLPQPRLLPPHEFVPDDLSRLGLTWSEPLLRWLPIPDSFLKGVVYTALLGQRGQVGYLHGEVAAGGWWFYFPVATFLKYPTGLLLAAAAGLVALWRGPWPNPVKSALTFPPLVIFVAAMAQSVHTGVRSILPLAPFLALWCAAALYAWRGKAARVVLALLLGSSVISGALAYPNFLTWFNPLMGGTAAADRWLVDSNLDWGQDLPELAQELERRGIREVRLAYFGAARPSHYGIVSLDPDVASPGWYAISRSFLSGWWPPGDPYAWLRQYRPETLVGGSIALFQVDEQQARKRLGEVDTAAHQQQLMNSGLAMLQSREPDAAMVQFRLVLELNPTHYGATYQLAVALDQANRPDEARPLWERVLEMAEGYDDGETASKARQRLGVAQLETE